MNSSNSIKTQNHLIFIRASKLSYENKNTDVAKEERECVSLSIIVQCDYNSNNELFLLVEKCH